MLHHFVPYLDAHADIDRAGTVGDMMLGADVFQPVRAAPSGCYYRMFRIDFAFHFSVGDVYALADIAL